MKLDLNEIKANLEAFKDSLRADLLVYTRQAFQILPRIHNPEILDIGCGSGLPTIELALMSDGIITAIDINQATLDVLIKRAAKAGLSDRITVLNQSLVNMDFPSERFDIIWAEGSIAVIGFDRGLIEFKTFIKNGGYLVVHDEKDQLKKKIKAINRIGYELIDYFILNDEVWRKTYYTPLEKYINDLQAKYPRNNRIRILLQNDLREINEYYVNSNRYQSVFFIMKKI
jgi:ubiquinone/menaquinone biosynthesis C-methylase UbiE